MSTYKGIRGLKVRDYTTNPDNPIEGQLWYNATDNVAKYQVPQVLSSWSSVGSLNTARGVPGGLGATYNAALYIGGSQTVASVEQYNGTLWTEVADLNTGRQTLGGAGSSTSALAFGGASPTTGETQ